MSAERLAGAVAGVAAGAIVVCCGVSVLLSVGAGITIAGLGLRSWALAAVALIALFLGIVRCRQLRSCPRVPPAKRTEGADHADRDRAR